MFSVKRWFVVMVGSVLLVICLQIILHPWNRRSCSWHNHTFMRHTQRLHNDTEHPNRSSDGGTRLAPGAARVQTFDGIENFDATMLTDDEERHVERLSRLKADIVGMRDFLVRRFATSGKSDKTEDFKTLMKAREFLRVMEADIDGIKKTDKTVKKSMDHMRKLHIYVQAAIQRLQNPDNCTSAPKLRCNLENIYGFSSGVHDILWCLVAAMQMGRTVILDTQRWQYAPGVDGWTKIFQPLAGHACVDAGSLNMIASGYPGYSFYIEERPTLLHLPASFVKRLVANHADPYAWWYGQIIRYILRLQNSIRKQIEDFKKDNGYKHPIVAVHVRRREKRVETGYHYAPDYMQHAEEFYNKLTLNGENVQRRIFLATDDPAVEEEINSKLPNYTVISNKVAARDAYHIKNRKRNSSLPALLTDIYLMAEADHLICALSSGFCRIAYSLMQALHAEAGIDATFKTVTVDVLYNYAWVLFPPRRTLYHNERLLRREVQWSTPGYLLEKVGHHAYALEAVRKNHADGFNTGRIKGTSVDADASVFPRFKTVQTFPFMNYAAFNSSDLASQGAID